MGFADSEVRVEGLKKRLKMAEGHIEAGRLLSFYQVYTSHLGIMILSFAYTQRYAGTISLPRLARFSYSSLALCGDC